MKKVSALFLTLALLMLVALSGCGNNGFKNQINKSSGKIKAAKSYSFEGTSDMKVNGQAAETLKFTGSYKAPAETYTKNILTYMGQTVNVETYQKDNNNFYTKTANKWEKMSATDAQSIKSSGAGGNPTDMLKDMMDNAKSFTTEKDQTIKGKKYKVVKITIKADKLKEKAKRDVTANYNEMVKSAKPEEKKAVQDQKKQMDEFLKTLDIKVTYTAFIDSTSNDLWKVEMDQIVNSVIQKQKTENRQLLSVTFKDLNKTVSMPDINK